MGTWTVTVLGMTSIQVDLHSIRVNGCWLDVDAQIALPIGDRTTQASSHPIDLRFGASPPRTKRNHLTSSSP